MTSLAEIASELTAGGSGPSPTLTEFLSWFGVQRRGYYKVRAIREALAAANLRTEPDFEEAWWGATLSLHLRESVTTPLSEVRPDAEIQVESSSDEREDAPVWVGRDATYLISRLQNARKSLVVCKPDDDIIGVTTKMMKGGYSQIPVMETERRVKGVVSWQSIGSRRALDAKGNTARAFMEPPHVIDSSKSIFDAINIIASNDYVLIKDDDDTISGILTASDLTLQFRDLTEPFLLLSEIENIVRNLIGPHFDLDDLRDACDSREPKRIENLRGVDDLQFGEYVRLLEKPERWKKLGLKIDRAIFCSDLVKVRDIRNNVMHFNPEGVEPSEIAHLRELTRFLQQIAKITDIYQV